MDRRFRAFHPWRSDGKTEQIRIDFLNEHSARNYITEVNIMDPYDVVDDNWFVEMVNVRPGDIEPTSPAFTGFPPTDVIYSKSVVFDETMRHGEIITDAFLYFHHLRYDKEVFPEYHNNGRVYERYKIYNIHGRKRMVLSTEGPYLTDVENRFDELFTSHRTQEEFLMNVAHVETREI